MSDEKSVNIKGHNLSESYASKSQLDARSELEGFFKNSPLPDDELLMSLGLYIRGSVLVKTLALEEVYKRILGIPGCIMEFGTRWGQNIVLFENFRAIFEPFNKTRKIIGFDTFEGYEGHSTKDSESDIFTANTYQTTQGYENYLRALITSHEKNNILGHVNGNHEVIKGNASVTVANYLSEREETLIALAYFDMGLYEPTKQALLAIKPHLMPGSVILLDELTWAESPGEAIAFKEVFDMSEYTIEKSTLTPMRSIVTIK